MLNKRITSKYYKQILILLRDNMKDLFNVEGKVALVTGGSRGIGAMIAEGFVKNGIKTYITSRKSEQCDNKADELSKFGECISIPADLTDMNEMDKLVNHIKENEKQLNILINNAGAAWGASFDDFPENGWDKVMDTNVKSVFFLTQKLAKIFVESSPYETRLQVLYFLFGVAKADGSVSQSELSKIDQIASALGIRISDFESIKAMFFEDSDSAYKILEISPNVSDSEVKKAYREMAKKYHPDKLQSKDPALIKGAQEKFQEVQKAYETIQNERGL